MEGIIEKARHVIVNRLEVPRLTRHDHNTTFRCEASNTNLVSVVEMSTRVEMLRKFSWLRPIPIISDILYLFFIYSPTWQEASVDVDQTLDIFGLRSRTPI